jgi:hypothetical protein
MRKIFESHEVTGEKYRGFRIELNSNVSRRHRIQKGIVFNATGTEEQKQRR